MEHQTKVRVYNFHLSGEQGIYEVVFRIDDENIESSCTCNYHSSQKYCWHQYYVLANKKHRLPEEEFAMQEELIAQLRKTSGGKELISHAKRKFGEKETCRRCNSSEVVDLKKSFTGKIISLFIPKERRYFCWSCRWSW